MNMTANAFAFLLHHENISGSYLVILDPDGKGAIHEVSNNPYDDASVVISPDTVVRAFNDRDHPQHEDVVHAFPRSDADETFTYDPANLPDLPEKTDLAEDLDALDELMQWFNDFVNRDLNDPFVTDMCWEGEPIHFHGDGSEERLLSRITLIAALDPTRITALDLFIRSDDNAEECTGIDWEESAGVDTDVAALIELAVDENPFSGMDEPEYNDNSADNHSGYSHYASCIRVTALDLDDRIAALPARERMSARPRLRAWVQSRGHNPNRYALLKKSAAA